MQSSNFGGTFDQPFLWIFLVKFSQKMPLHFFYTMVPKCQKWPWTQSQIKGGPALSENVINWWCQTYTYLSFHSCIVCLKPVKVNVFAISIFNLLLSSFGFLVTSNQIFERSVELQANLLDLLRGQGSWESPLAQHANQKVSRGDKLTLRAVRSAAILLFVLRAGSSWLPLLLVSFPSFSLFPTPNRPCQSERSSKARHEADSFEPAEWSERLTPGQSGWLGAAAVGSIPALALSLFLQRLYFLIFLQTDLWSSVWFSTAAEIRYQKSLTRFWRKGNWEEVCQVSRPRHWPFES